MNNKRLGTAFEKEMCDVLRKAGYWVHFMQPNAAGAQPFDIVGSKNSIPLAMDCKTSSIPYISISRLEDNQIMSFELWKKCGNPDPLIAVKHEEKIYVIPYQKLKELGKVYLTHEYEWKENEDVL